jgi:hypothetical protein
MNSERRESCNPMFTYEFISLVTVCSHAVTVVALPLCLVSLHSCYWELRESRKLLSARHSDALKNQTNKQ